MPLLQCKLRNTVQILHRRNHLQNNKLQKQRRGIINAVVEQNQQKRVNSDRLWSRLNPETLKHEPGSVLGSAALVAGTTVGAGILALPAVTQESGFIPSSVAVFACFIFSIVGGLLLAEVNINTMCELGGGGVSIVSMTERTLGKPGTRVACLAYIFLHYALLVAYISRGGQEVGSLLGLPGIVGSLLFCGSVGGFCFFSNSKTMDRVNGFLVVAVIATFVGLLVLAAGGTDPGNLARQDWSAVPDTIPVIALAFVYHNVIPVIASNLEGDIGKVRLSIIIGVSIPLVMFLAWDAAILGSTGQQLSPGTDPLMALKETSEAVGPLVEGFSFLAITTSFIGFVLGLSDFLGDALKLPSGQQPVPYAITLIPPFIFAITYPDVFFKALDVAGTYGVLVLFGLFPAAMAWSERYQDTTLSRFRIVPGGKLSLVLMIACGSTVIAKELFEALNYFTQIQI